MSWWHELFFRQRNPNLVIVNNHWEMKPFIEAQREVYRDENIFRQKIFDINYEADAKARAITTYYQWKTQCILYPNGGEPLVFFNPCGPAYFIYDEATAKYKDANWGELVRAEFERLKKDEK